jgi:hypothetical protein
MPIGSSQSRAAIGAEWNHRFMKGAYTNNRCNTASTPIAIQDLCPYLVPQFATGDPKRQFLFYPYREYGVSQLWNVPTRASFQPG